MDGFNAFGLPVPNHRKQAAYDYLRTDILLDAELAQHTVSFASEQIERDKPYETMETLQNVVDLCGAYRVLAILCTN